jgi:hypothetical protein
MQTNSIEQTIAPFRLKKQAGRDDDQGAIQPEDARAGVSGLRGLGGWWRGGRTDLDEGWRSRLGRTHRSLMLSARGGIQVNRDACGDEYGGVEAEVEIAGDAKDDGKGQQNEEECDPTAFKTEATAG